MGHIRVHTSELTTHTLQPPKGSIMIHAPTLQFRAKNKNGKTQITVISCKDLPDTDGAGIGFGNKSDPYVTVGVGKDGEKQQTKAIRGKLDPVFKNDDLIGKAQIKLTQGQANGVLLSLALKVKEE